MTDKMGDYVNFISNHKHEFKCLISGFLWKLKQRSIIGVTLYDFSLTLNRPAKVVDFKVVTRTDLKQ